ncbi:hypothetical protein [Janibacter indicus]
MRSHGAAIEQPAPPATGGYRSAGTHDELVAAGGRYARLWAAWTA